MVWKKLTEKDLRRIAREHGLYPTDIYVKFMQTRFPNEGDEHYAGEWATRFKTGDPTSYMDSKSLNAYMNAVKKIRKVL